MKSSTNEQLTQPFPAAIDVAGLSGGYGSLRVVRDVHLRVVRGRTTALLGPNGAGKTSLVKLIVGLIDRHAGAVKVDGADVTGRSYAQRLRRMGWVPEGRPLFDRYSVTDNLELAGVAARMSRRRVAERLNELYELFPEIARRRKLRAASLSGGERQMLALARVLMSDPTVIVLDEPSIGLAPLVLERLHHVLAELRGEGRTLLVCEQNTGWLRGIVDDVAIMAGGRIVATGDAALMANQDELARHYVGFDGLLPDTKIANANAPAVGGQG